MGVTLLRHTQPDIAPGVCYGQTDLGLAEGFLADADALSARLPGPGRPEFERIVTSPLLRCRTLAEVLSKSKGLTVEVDARIKEMDFGAWECQPWSEIPRPELDAWAADFLHARPHGGESVAMLKHRVDRALADIRQAGQSTLVVTHSGIIRVVLARGDRAEDFDAAVGFGEWVDLDG
ncbi:MAG: alpha-ribazole phosphatase [Pseudomonadota bacterium]